MDTTRVITLKRALDELPLWGIAPPQKITPLRSGLTNRSYLLETAYGDFVIRLNNNNAFKLGISRRNEHRMLDAIEDEDFAPETVYMCPSYSYLLTRHIKGESFAQKAPSAREQEQLRAIVDYYQNELDLQLAPVSYRSQLQAYYTTALESNAVDVKTADDWHAFQDELELFESTVPATELCHGDLTPANVIRSGNSLKIIDWEFANAGHPQFDYLCANLIEANTPELKRLKTVLTWLERLWLTIIPYYPKAPEENGDALIQQQLYQYYD